VSGAVGNVEVISVGHNLLPGLPSAIIPFCTICMG
jgi:hypothetical protein